MADKNDDFGYGKVDEIETTSRFLHFKKGDKGRIIHIRLVSKPQYTNQHWVMDEKGTKRPTNCLEKDCKYCKDETCPRDQDPRQKVAKWGWVVIDRADGNVKLFTGPTQIARKIKDLAEDVDWGNPMLYDIKIKRTEEPGAGYYQVVPSPTDKGKDIAAEEKKKVEEAKIDLSKELAGSNESEHVGNYGTDLETSPAGGSGTPAKMDENVNADDIPF